MEALQQLSGHEVTRRVRQEGEACLLSFSMGKDAICAWLAIRDQFTRVVPYYLYLVPGLEFIEDGLQYFERVMGCRIWRLPHPGLYRMLNGLVFQPPERCAIIEQAELPDFDYEDINRILKEDLALPAETFCATGVRAADSPLRYLHFKRNGAINWKQRKFYPVWDWRKAHVIEAIRNAGIKLPVDYQWFGRTFDGLDLRFLYPIKQHAPADYQRILEWFPLAELEVFRYEHRAQS
jgi:3'-phosphoadenosine 5'-phosphosulfate sulfotransferase (PAPS reductase)/FAD synthetase